MRLRFPASSLISLLLLTLIRASSLPYNVTVSDQSPTVEYGPFREGAINKGWNCSYSITPWSLWQNDLIASGISAHETTFVGASVVLRFYGTAVWFWGNATTGAYSVSMDGTEDGLGESWHVVNMSLVAAGEISFIGATFTTQLVSDGSDAKNETITAVDQNGAVNSYFSIPNGGWRSNLFGTTGNSTQSQDGYLAYGAYPRLDTATVGAPVEFITRPNASMVFIYGTVSAENGGYHVRLTPQNTLNTSSPTVENQTFQAYSPWLSVDQPKYYATLDPRTQYTVTIILSAANFKLDLHHVTFISALSNATTSADPTTSQPAGIGSGTSAKSSKAGVIGGAVGGVVGGLLLLGVLVFFLLRRRRRQNRREPFDVDGYHEETYKAGPASRPNPYADPSVTAYTHPIRAGSNDSSTDVPSSTPFLNPSSSGYPESVSHSGSESISAGAGITGFAQSRTYTSPSDYSSPSPGPDSNSNYPILTSNNNSSNNAMSLKQQLIARRSIQNRHGNEMTESEWQDQDAGPVLADDRGAVPPSYNPEWAGSSSELAPPVRIGEGGGAGGEGEGDGRSMRSVKR